MLHIDYLQESNNIIVVYIGRKRNVSRAHVGLCFSLYITWHGSDLFQVTKPVIDEDIRILKDVGYNIVGIPGHHGGYQLVDYEGAAKMILDSERARRFEEICGKLPEDDKHILSYVMNLAEMGNIV